MEKFHFLCSFHGNYFQMFVTFIPKHIINRLNVHTHRVFIYDVRATRTKHLFHLSAFHCELLQMYESSAIWFYPTNNRTNSDLSDEMPATSSLELSFSDTIHFCLKWIAVTFE